MFLLLHDVLLKQPDGQVAHIMYKINLRFTINGAQCSHFPDFRRFLLPKIIINVNKQLTLSWNEHVIVDVCYLAKRLYLCLLMLSKYDSKSLQLPIKLKRYKHAGINKLIDKYFMN